MSIETILNNETYKAVLDDSCGGLMYNVGNRGKYNAAEVLKLWDGLSDAERGAADGIMQGAISFLKGE